MSTILTISVRTDGRVMLAGGGLLIYPVEQECENLLTNGFTNVDNSKYEIIRINTPENVMSKSCRII